MNSHHYTMITGASEGFGKSLAIECAKRKMNLILVALPASDLCGLASAIRREYNVDVVSIEKDLCEESSCIEIFNYVSALGLKVNILVNNAGIGCTVLFEEGNIASYEKQIKLNVLATTLLCRLFLKTLKQNSPSYILNVGSLASHFHLPKKQVYGATKSFIYYFSRSLRKELRKDKVYVSVLCPGGMTTNTIVTQTIRSGNYFSRMSSMEPEDVVPVALNGLLNKKEVIVPGRWNNLFLILDKMLPAFIKTILTNHTMKSLNKPAMNSFSINHMLSQHQVVPQVIDKNLPSDKFINHV
jgi:uncharacterized protein